MADVITNSSDERRENAIDAVWAVMSRTGKYRNLQSQEYQSYKTGDKPRPEAIKNRIGTCSWEQTVETVYEQRSNSKQNAGEQATEVDNPTQGPDWSRLR